MPTFEEQLYGAYTVPDEVKQVKNESGFYEHPLGIYVGKIGGMEFKFVNPEGKRCKPSDPGATVDRAVLRIYLMKYLGTPEAPQEIKIIDPDLTLPANKTSYEMYYPLSMSLAAKFQWYPAKLFDNFVVPDIDDSKIIKEKMVRYNKFPLYRGLEVKFEIKKNGKYTNFDNISQLDTPRVPIDIMNKLESDIKMLQEQEKENKNDSSPKPTASADDILGDFSPSDARPNEVENDDLPF